MVTALCALIPLLCLAVPLYVIRPFRPQAAAALAFALAVRQAAPWLSALCAVVAIAVSCWAWRSAGRPLKRAALAAFCAVAIAAACLTHINVFEIMFHPYPAPAFGAWQASNTAPDDMVIAVTIGNRSRAYPIRTLGYHHIVNDTVGGEPIAITYCTLCHTGLIWGRVVGGKTLYFRLAGINNGNALLRDKQTGSIWQQSTGEAIFGPLKGTHLKLVPSDELTAALWHKERPDGDILLPDAVYAPEYDPKDWEKHVEKTRVVVDTSRSGIPPHELMFGLTVAGESKAYPVRSILADKLIQDQVADTPILLLVGPDSASIRGFRAQLAGRAGKLIFLPVSSRIAGSNQAVMTDAETGSTWNFQGCAVSGPYAGNCLQRIDANKDYWFDWLNHHPATAVFPG